MTKPSEPLFTSILAMWAWLPALLAAFLASWLVISSYFRAFGRTGKPPDE